jgi:cytochrome c nitrite reductase small subunit
MVGLALGIGVVTFDHAEGLSYFSTDPAACVNCHIMQPQYDAWQKGPHHAAATCAGCHLPVEFPDLYLEKARNGWNHSAAFTLGGFPEPIVITPSNARTLQDNCVRCHDSMTHAISEAVGPPTCVDCHADAGHGPRAGLGGPWDPTESQDRP